MLITYGTSIDVWLTLRKVVYTRLFVMLLLSKSPSAFFLVPKRMKYITLFPLTSFVSSASHNPSFARIFPSYNNNNGRSHRIDLSMVLAAVSAAAWMQNDRNSTSPSTARCAVGTEDRKSMNKQKPSEPIVSDMFPSHLFDFDHYNGVTMDLDQYEEEKEGQDLLFVDRLQQQLQHWKQQGVVRGVWVHIPPHRADYIPALSALGFDFHMVSPPTSTSHESQSQRNQNVLIMSQWLPESPSRLPAGPSHQVGIGCVVWHPLDKAGVGNPGERRLLVVQERTGPAAAWNLWKLPTGLADPDEDIHVAAMRELEEETGLKATFDGLLLVRQAHPMPTPVVISKESNDAKDSSAGKSRSKAASVKRKTSDLFFICQMTLQPPDDNASSSDDVDRYSDQLWKACPQEIAAIQWMSVQEYCNQNRWQSSPVYQAMNLAILESAANQPWHATTLPLWVNPKDASNKKDDVPHMNTFYSFVKTRETPHSTQ